MQRLYFVTKTEEVCDEIEESLVEQGVDPDRIFIFDDLAEEMVSLPDADVWRRKRTIPIFIYGIVLGGFAGFLAGVARLLEDDRLSTNLIIGAIIASAIAGGFLFRLAAGDEHDHRIEQFRKMVDKDGILLVVDAPGRLYRKLHTMVVARHPAKFLGAVSHAKLKA